MLHVWRTDSEQKALNAFRAPLKEQSVVWQEYADEDNFFGVKLEFRRRMAIKNPPSVIGWILGGEMQEMVNNQLIRPVPDQQHFYRDNLIPEVYRIVKMQDGNLSGVPVGIHVQNHFAFNLDILSRLDINKIESFEQLLSYGPKLKKDGISLLAVSDEQWQIRLLMVSILSTLLEKEEFEQLLTSGVEISTSIEERLAQAFQLLFRFREFANKDYKNKKWEDVINTVAEGRALGAILGDYVIPQLPKESALKVSCDLTPGHRFIVWGADAFIFPTVSKPDLLLGQEKFFAVLESRQNFENYTHFKGAIPVIKDAEFTSIHACLKTIREHWDKTDTKVFIAGKSWHKRFAALGFFIRNIWNKPGAEPQDAAKRLLRVLNSI